MKFLQASDFEFVFRDIKTENPSADEIKSWHELSGLDIQKFFNTSGLVYKSLGLKDRLKQMSLQEKYTLLATDGMLVKRPLLILKDKVLVGYKEEAYQEVVE